MHKSLIPSTSFVMFVWRCVGGPTFLAISYVWFKKEVALLLLSDPTRETGGGGDWPNFSKKKVLPGIEPGLPEDTEEIRIRSDNRYLLRSQLFGLI